MEKKPLRRRMIVPDWWLFASVRHFFIGFLCDWKEPHHFGLLEEQLEFSKVG
jgi:hypothetical protein